MKDEDYNLIEDRLRSHFQIISEEDLRELVAETATFLSSNESEWLTLSGSKDFLEDKELLKHINDYRSREQLSYRYANRPAFRRKLVSASDLDGRGENTETEDSRLTKLKINRSNASDKEAVDGVIGITETEELSKYQQRLAVWKAKLPAIEFEALELMTSDASTQHLTYGFTRRGLATLFRRARIRMKWLQENTNENEQFDLVDS